ncbi:GRIP and coiled-coil domain-containing protein 2-like [Bacillus rossius redtenbacheri]|uniref:GRIP and coiled-coil domain-containing protein 2-like n=1 Tax=Bacillus rossius redtenbacheri TaxID=93214 RepID=UPI002FDE0017
MTRSPSRAPPASPRVPGKPAGGAPSRPPQDRARDSSPTEVPRRAPVDREKTRTSRAGSRNQGVASSAAEPEVADKAASNPQTRGAPAGDVNANKAGAGNQTTSLAKGMKVDVSKENNTKIPRPSSARLPQKTSPRVPARDSDKRDLQLNKLQKTGVSHCVFTEPEMPSAPARTREAEGETRSEPELVVLRPVAPPRVKKLSAGAGEDPSTLSPASSARALLDPLRFGDQLANCDPNADLSKFTIEPLKAIDKEYNDICSTTAMKVLEVIKIIPGNVEVYANEEVTNFIKTDASEIHQRMARNHHKFECVLQFIERLHAHNSELFEKNKEKIYLLDQENVSLKSVRDSLENKIKEYETKCNEMSQILKTEVEKFERLQAEKCSVDLEMKTQLQTEREKCDKLEYKIECLQQEIKIKDEMYESRIKEYQQVTITSKDNMANIEREKQLLENRLVELTSENAKLSASIKDMRSRSETEKDQLKKDESRRKELVKDLENLKKKDLKDQETIKELEETIKIKKQMEDKLSSQMKALKEEQSKAEKKLLSQQQRIAALEKEKADALTEREASNSKKMAEKECLLHKMEEELKVCRKELECSKEKTKQLEENKANLLEAKAKDSNRLESLTKERHSMETALKEAFDYNGRIEQELEDVKQENEKLDRVIHEKDGLLMVRNDLIKLMQSNEAAHKKEKDRAANEIETYKRYFDKMQAELREKDAQMKSIVKELNKKASVMEKTKAVIELMERHQHDQRARLEEHLREVKSNNSPNLIKRKKVTK